MPISLFESPDGLRFFLSSSSVDQFQEILPQLPLSELAQSFTLLQAQPAIEAKKKLKSLFEFIDSPAILEVIGKNFSVSSFLSFLDFLTQHPSHQNRLKFILIGLHSLIFSQALHVLQKSHLYLLQQEGLLEPLQYQLTQFAHEGESLEQGINQSVQQFKQDLVSTQSEELTQDRLQKLTQHIDGLRNQILDYLERASAALAIVWHTDRIDLIEKLSSIHERIQYQLMHVIGHSAFDHLTATGLYSILEQTLSSIFDSALKDEDAAIEGLTRLSIWHLKDYWELGLLPSISHIQELDLNPKKHHEKEGWDHQQHLIALVQQQLEHLGIGTVKNLKQAHLYSRSLLKDYIERHQHLLFKE